MKHNEKRKESEDIKSKIIEAEYNKHSCNNTEYNTERNKQ